MAEVEDGNIPFASFDRADERAMQLAAIGKIGLRPTACQSHVANAPAHLAEVFPVVKIHRYLTTIIVQVMMCLSSITPKAVGRWRMLMRPNSTYLFGFITQKAGDLQCSA